MWSAYQRPFSSLKRGNIYSLNQQTFFNRTKDLLSSMIAVMLHRTMIASQWPPCRKVKCVTTARPSNEAFFGKKCVTHAR